jgi:hypothetical protein
MVISEMYVFELTLSVYLHIFGSCIAADSWSDSIESVSGFNRILSVVSYEFL